MKYFVALLLVIAITIQVSTQSRIGDDIKSAVNNMVEYVESFLSSLRAKLSDKLYFEPNSISDAMKDAGYSIGNALENAGQTIKSAL